MGFHFSLLPLIPFLQHVEGLFLLALVGEETLHVVVVLDAGEHASGRAEVLQDPGRGASQAVDLSRLYYCVLRTSLGFMPVLILNLAEK